MCHVVYAGETAPLSFSKSIFLVGPTPRDADTASWRPMMIDTLEAIGYDGEIFSPEPRDGKWQSTYDGQVEWEKKHLNMADMILAWVPREKQKMPAFTTNVEFGKYVTSGKLIYGRPKWAEKVRYLDWMYQDHGYGEPFDNINHIAQVAVTRLGEGALRTNAQTSIPIAIWSLNAFQQWLEKQKNLGHQINKASVLWEMNYVKPPGIYSYGLRMVIGTPRGVVYTGDYVLTKNSETLIESDHRYGSTMSAF